MYTGPAAEVLDRFGASEGDRVELSLRRPMKRTDGAVGPLTLRGTVMGPFGPDADATLVLKLESGYNFAFAPADVNYVKVLGRQDTSPVPARRTVEDLSLPLVALIGTGGTIASYVDRTTGAVRPVSSADELGYLLPELGSICRIDVSVPMSKLSEDMTSGDWSLVANEVIGAFGRGARGVVIAHGTDTMAFTGAALSFLLRDLPGPVVLTGSQRSSDRPSSDSFLNLARSLMLAARSDLGEVCVLMHSSVSDDASTVHRACRVRKMHTSRRDAFVSVNSATLGSVTESGVHLTAPYRRADPSKVPYLAGGFSDLVSLVNAVPTLDTPLLLSIGRMVKVLVIAGTGLGHVSSRLIPAVRELVSEGRVVIMASQCINGRVNLRVYSTGRALLEAGVLEASDMTPETAMVKAMWCLGTLGKDGWSLQGFKELFLTDICGEIDARSPLLDLQLGHSLPGPEGERA